MQAWCDEAGMRHSSSWPCFKWDDQAIKPAHISYSFFTRWSIRNLIVCASSKENVTCYMMTILSGFKCVWCFFTYLYFKIKSNILHKVTRFLFLIIYKQSLSHFVINMFIKWLLRQRNIHNQNAFQFGYYSWN